VFKLFQFYFLPQFWQEYDVAGFAGILQFLQASRLLTIDF